MCVFVLSPLSTPHSPGCLSCPRGQRYFVLEDGILRYATTRQDVSRVPGLGFGGNLPQDVLNR